MEQAIERAVYWKTYCNVVQQLEDRGYYVPQKYYVKDLTPVQFEEKYLGCLLFEPFVLSSLSIVASKYHPKDLTSVLKLHTDSIELPNINHAINMVLQSKNELNKLLNDQDSNLELYMDVDEESKRKYLQMFDLQVPQFREDEVLVLFVRKLNKATGIEGIEQLTKYRDLMNCKHLILVGDNVSDPKNALTNRCGKEIAPARFATPTIEWFSFREKRFNPSNTLNHGKFIRYTTEQRDKWLKERNLTLDKVCTIALDDAADLYYDLRYGDLIRIDEFDGNSRFVVIGINK